MDMLSANVYTSANVLAPTSRRTVYSDCGMTCAVKPALKKLIRPVTGSASCGPALRSRDLLPNSRAGVGGVLSGPFLHFQEKVGGS
eukprot:5389074-Amphidinium_carterae.1